VRRLFLLCFAIGILYQVPNNGIAGTFNPGYDGFITPFHKAEHGYTKQAGFLGLCFQPVPFTANQKRGQGGEKRRGKKLRRIHL
jgi:hypothetical protein